MAPWLQSGWSPISPEALTLELGLRRNRPNPNGSGAGLGPGLDLVPELPMKSWFAIMARR